MRQLDQGNLGQYLYFWASTNITEILNFGEDVAFDSSPESWPVFRIELTGILIKRGLLELLPTMSGDGAG